MFCPKCGAENADTNKFCRACREDLKIVAQAMKQSLPLLLASKLDQMFDSRSERFRRDSLMMFVLALAFLASGILKWNASGDGKLFIGFSVVLLLVSGWEYLAFKRSLSPGFQWEPVSASSDSADSGQPRKLASLEVNDAAISLPVEHFSLTEATTRELAERSASTVRRKEQEH